MKKICMYCGSIENVKKMNHSILVCERCVPRHIHDEAQCDFAFDSKREENRFYLADEDERYHDSFRLEGKGE